MSTGSRLRSQVCGTEIIVMRAPGDDIDLRCGGYPMVALGSPAETDLEPDRRFTEGSLLGKRYTCCDGVLEVLVTKAGAGTLTIGESELDIKVPTPLPSSD